ncbi:MAG TPA: hypothetical protein VHE35_10950 [Kofleriaceae bacterium]|nr:hypothetical protein [Kofleriaceae bacterium]
MRIDKAVAHGLAPGVSVVGIGEGDADRRDREGGLDEGGLGARRLFMRLMLPRAPLADVRRP